VTSTILREEKYFESYERLSIIFSRRLMSARELMSLWLKPLAQLRIEKGEIEYCKTFVLDTVLLRTMYRLIYFEAKA
jgi:hypothetical protein